MNYKLYEVGGRVRDSLLGIKSKDIDYSVVVEDVNPSLSAFEVFDHFKKVIEKEGYNVFQTSRKTLTLRANFPKDHLHSGVADFVIARKEYYPLTSRIPVTEIGSLYDDLLRRDFTVNAMAVSEDGAIIDYFSGRKDLSDGILRTTADAAVSFNQDPLRLLRALRFHITKGFSFSDEIVTAIELFNPNRFDLVSTERIMSEIDKMFSFDTYGTLRVLDWLEYINSPLYLKIFKSFRLTTTNKKK